MNTYLIEKFDNELELLSAITTDYDEESPLGKYLLNLACTFEDEKQLEELKEEINSYSSFDLQIMNAYIGYTGSLYFHNTSLEDIYQLATENFAGMFISDYDIGEHFFEELGCTISDKAANYFDYEAFGRDVRIGSLMEYESFYFFNH